ncbi:DNA pilot protein [Flyfo microvirus Tbat2_185]|nr:DNA pilot protein [Flyfo microvirus Tbat2_185]
MALPLLAAAIPAALSFGGNIIGNLFNRKAQKDANKTNIQLAHYTNTENIKQWNRANAYNTPEAQMQRFKDAGLNPNLIYGQQNTAAASPRMDMPTVNAPQFNGFDSVIPAMQLYMDIKQRNAQLDNLKAQNELVRAQTVSEGVRNGLTTAQTAREHHNLRMAHHLEQNSYDTAAANLRHLNISTTNEYLKSNLLNRDATLRDYQIDEARFDSQLRQFGVTNNAKWWVKMLFKNMMNVNDVIRR